jgi:hypothetical protein
MDLDLLSHARANKGKSQRKSQNEESKPLTKGMMSMEAMVLLLPAPDRNKLILAIRRHQIAVGVNNDRFPLVIRRKDRDHLGILARLEKLESCVEEVFRWLVSLGNFLPQSLVDSEDTMFLWI